MQRIKMERDETKALDKSHIYMFLLGALTLLCIVAFVVSNVAYVSMLPKEPGLEAFTKRIVGSGGAGTCVRNPDRIARVYRILSPAGRDSIRNCVDFLEDEAALSCGE
jgi:hypothetical protein